MAEIIHKGRHYTACVLNDGSLAVTRNSKRMRTDGNRGKRLVGTNAAHWIAEIRTAIDTSEAEALCRAFLSP